MKSTYLEQSGLRGLGACSGFQTHYPVEMEFLHRVAKKAFWDPHMGKNYWSKYKDSKKSPQVLGVSFMTRWTRWLSSVSLWKKSSLVFTKLRRARV